MFSHKCRIENMGVQTVIDGRPTSYGKMSMEERNPLLYDPSLPDSKDTDKRNADWHKVVQTVRESGELFIYLFIAKKC